MEIFHSTDGSVTKFIHDDFSETAIKVVKSCVNVKDPATGYITTDWVEKNKYSVLISSSLGCYMSCSFCHLTLKKSTYTKLTTEQVVKNVQEAILYEVERNPDIRNRYIKLCWMGMGDCVNQPYMVLHATIAILNWVINNKLAIGVDGVDVSSVVPPVNDAFVDAFVDLNLYINNHQHRYPSNPANKEAGRSRFRMFYSLHSAVQTTRDKIIPRAKPLFEVIPLLKQLENNGINVIFHQLFIDDINDTLSEAETIINFMRSYFPESELRVLRYNSCERYTDLKESSKIDIAIKVLNMNLNKIKVQISAGAEVSAACGQFLVAMPKIIEGK